MTESTQSLFRLKLNVRMNFRWTAGKKREAPDIAAASTQGGIRNRFGGGENINRIYRIRLTVIVGDIKVVIDLDVP